MGIGLFPLFDFLNNASIKLIHKFLWGPIFSSLLGRHLGELPGHRYCPFSVRPGNDFAHILSPFLVNRDTATNHLVDHGCLVTFVDCGETGYSVPQTFSCSGWTFRSMHISKNWERRAWSRRIYTATPCFLHISWRSLKMSMSVNTSITTAITYRWNGEEHMVSL